MIRKSTVALAASGDEVNTPFVATVGPQAIAVAKAVPPFWVSATFAVPEFVWHDHDVAVIKPIMFTKKLFWLSLVVSTDAVVVLSEPAM